MFLTAPRPATPTEANDPVAPLGVYGRQRTAKGAVRRPGPKAIILRTAWVYAAHGGNFVRTMLRVGADRDHLRVVDDQRGTPTSAADIAAALLGHRRAPGGDRAGRRTMPGSSTWRARGEASWHDLADAIFSVAPIWGRRPVVGDHHRGVSDAGGPAGLFGLGHGLVARVFGRAAARGGVADCVDDVLTTPPGINQQRAERGGWQK